MSKYKDSSWTTYELSLLIEGQLALIHSFLNVNCNVTCVSFASSELCEHS